MQNNPIWQYSLSIYSRPKVSELCLELQNNWDGDVNLLLCTAWLSSIGQSLTEGLLDDLLLLSTEWQEGCIKPLRLARQFVKNRADESVYQQAKRLELEAESQLQQLFYQQCRHLPLVAADKGLLQVNIQCYLKALNIPANTAPQSDQWALSFCEALSVS